MGASSGGMGGSPTSTATTGGGSQGVFGTQAPTVNPNGSVYAGPMAGSPASGGYGGGYSSPFGSGYGGVYGGSMGGYSPFRGGMGYGTPFYSQQQPFYGTQGNIPLPLNPYNPNQPVTRTYTYTPHPTMQQNESGELYWLLLNAIHGVQQQPITMTYTDPYSGGGYSPFQQNQNLMVAGSPVQQQVATAYQQLFGRPAETSGANYWTNQFQGQNLSQQDINRQIMAGAGGSDIGAARDYALSQMRGVRPSSTEKQFYQPVYQSQYTNYSRSPFMYSPSYSSGIMGNPFAYGGGGGGYQSPFMMTSYATPSQSGAYDPYAGGFAIKTGGQIEYKDGIASLVKDE